MAGLPSRASRALSRWTLSAPGRPNSNAVGLTAAVLSTCVAVSCTTGLGEAFDSPVSLEAGVHDGGDVTVISSPDDDAVADDVVDPDDVPNAPKTDDTTPNDDTGFGDESTADEPRTDDDGEPLDDTTSDDSDDDGVSQVEDDDVTQPGLDDIPDDPLDAGLAPPASHTDASTGSVTEAGSVAVLTNSQPSAGTTDVAVDTTLRLTFDQEMQSGPGAIELREGLDAVLVDEVETSSDGVTFDGNHVEVTWNAPLQYARRYSVLIDPTALVSSSGERFSGIDDPELLSFTTEPPPPLTLESSEPMHLASDVPIDTTIRLSFDSDIVAGAIGNLTLIEAGTLDVVQTDSVSGSPRVEIDGRTLTLQLVTELDYASGYFLTLDADAIRSSDGASFAGFSDDATLSFTTEAPPTLQLLETAPADDAADVDPDVNLVLTFSEPIVRGSGSIDVFDADTNALFESLAVDSENVAVSNVSLTVYLQASLDNATEYYVIIAPGAVQSVRGASYQGLSSPTAMNFTTAAAPPPPLSLVGTTPADDATDVDAETDIVLVFSESVAKGSGSITVFRSSDDTVVEGVAVSSNDVTVQDDTVTIELDASLMDDTEYYVTIGAGAFVSLQGASFPGIQDQTSLSFTTDDPFVLLSVSPVDGASDVDPDANLVLTFSAPVELGSGDLVVSSDSIFETVALDGPRVSANDSVVTVDLSGTLAYATSYWVNVDAGAINELGGGEFPGIADMTTWNFSTIDACSNGEVQGANGNCYHAYAPSGAEVSWASARAACESRGSGWDLATIRTPADQDFIEGLLDSTFPTAQLWIGGSDQETEGAWIWVSDATQFWSGNHSGTEVDGRFTNWKSDQPTGGTSQNCARVLPEDGNWLWADESCDQEFGFVCEGPSN